MKLVVIVLLGLMMVSLCLAVPRKALMEAEMKKLEADVEGESSGNSGITTMGNHHEIPLDKFKDYMNGPGKLPPSKGN